MTRATLERMCPFFIVSDVARSIAFYRDTLGFQTWYQEPDEVLFSRSSAAMGRNSSSRQAMPRRCRTRRAIRP